jgi:hypothetical protein
VPSSARVYPGARSCMRLTWGMPVPTVPCWLVWHQIIENVSAQPMITKDYFMAKTFRAYGANFFRQEKSLRDHGGSLAMGWTPDMVRRHGSVPAHHEHPLAKRHWGIITERQC